MMKKAIYVILLAAFAAVSLTSCKKEKTPEIILFKASESSFELDDEASKVSLSVTTNIGLSVLSAPDWVTADCSASQVKKGDKLPETASSVNVFLRVASNESHEERKGEVVLEGIARDGHTVRISVTQKGRPYSFSYVAKGNYLESPKFSGTDVGGIIEWGDGAPETYRSGACHKYSGDYSHTVKVTITSGTASKVCLEGLNGVTKIDLTSF